MDVRAPPIPPPRIIDPPPMFETPRSSVFVETRTSVFVETRRVSAGRYTGMTFDNFRLISVLGRGHFGKVHTRHNIFYFLFSHFNPNCNFFR